MAILNVNETKGGGNAAAGAGEGTVPVGRKHRKREHRVRRKLVAFRLRVPLVEILKSISDRQGIPQSHLLERCLALHVRDVDRALYETLRKL